MTRRRRTGSTRRCRRPGTRRTRASVPGSRRRCAAVLAAGRACTRSTARRRRRRRWCRPVMMIPPAPVTLPPPRPPAAAPEPAAPLGHRPRPSSMRWVSYPRMRRRSARTASVITSPSPKRGMRFGVACRGQKGSRQVRLGYRTSRLAEEVGRAEDAAQLAAEPDPVPPLSVSPKRTPARRVRRPRHSA